MEMFCNLLSTHWFLCFVLSSEEIERAREHLTMMVTQHSIVLNTTKQMDFIMKGLE